MPNSFTNRFAIGNRVAAVWALMNAQERNEYRDKMRNAKTKEELDAIRRKHHEEMKARA